MKIFTNNGTAGAYDITHIPGNKDIYTLTGSNDSLIYENIDRRYIVNNGDSIGFKDNDGEGNSSFKFNDEYAEFNFVFVELLPSVMKDMLIGTGIGIDVINGAYTINTYDATFGDNASKLDHYHNNLESVGTGWGVSFDAGIGKEFNIGDFYTTHQTSGGWATSSFTVSTSSNGTDWTELYTYDNPTNVSEDKIHTMTGRARFFKLISTGTESNGYGYIFFGGGARGNNQRSWDIEISQ